MNFINNKQKMCPKKLNPNNNQKIEALFGNMERDSKKQQNLKMSKEKQNKKEMPKEKPKAKQIEKEKEKDKSKKSKEVQKPKNTNQKSKVKITEEEKKEEKKLKSKPMKVISNSKKDIKDDAKNKGGSPIKKKLKKKVIEDSESYSISKDLNNEEDEDYKMDIEEEKEIAKKGKSKSRSKDKGKGKNNNKKNEKIFEDEDIDIDMYKLDAALEEEINEELRWTGKKNKKGENKNNKKAKEEEKEKEKEDEKDNNKNKGKGKESTNKKSTRKKSKDVKSTTNKKGRKNSASSDSNIIDGPLSDDTIVITGEFSIKRDEITKILKNLGARVTTSVSSRTTILLHGELLEDGRPYDQGRKYKQAVEKNIETMDLSSFEEYVRKKTKNPNWSIENNNNKIEELELDMEEIPEEPKNNKNKKNKTIEQNQGELWTTKYQPKKISDLIGNKTNINKLIEWLDDWNSVVLEGKTKKVETKFHRGQRPTFENVNARACLITGDPGIGKTSSVRLIAKLKGYKTYETNASDQRNKLAINKNAGFMFDNKTLFGGELQDKNLIIMDEVDGMSGNEDRGGIAAIIDIIKKTKTPIICIANDRQSPKLKTLANYCYDLKFVHPDKRTISIRLAEICKKENISCELNALDYICEICGNDIRQIMNFIELWARTHKTIKFSDLTGSGQKMEGKDEVVMLTNFDAAKELLNSKSKSLPFRSLLDLYFIDYDLIPLLIYENYLSTFPSQNYKSQTEELESISLAADCISESDVLDKKIRTNMDWRLLADRGLIGCCTICKINKGFVPFPKFPEALGKISSLNKIKRETTELKECFYSSSGEEIRRQILPVIYTYLVNYIVDGDIDGALEMMKNNHITMELFKENMTDLVSDKLKSSFDKVGTANKSNLTRAYNKNFKTSIIRNKNKKGKNKTSVDVNNEKVFDENGNPLNDIEGENENEEENDESSETIINGKKGKTKTKGNKNRSRSRSKSNDNKNSKSKSKSKSKGKVKSKDEKAKGKKKAKKTKKKKNDDDDFIDDEDYDE